MAYFVSCISGRRVAYLAGPFPEHQQALDMVDAAKAKAMEIDPFLSFAYFGTCRWKDQSAAPVGKLNAALGVEVAQ